MKCRVLQRPADLEVESHMEPVDMNPGDWTFLHRSWYLFFFCFFFFSFDFGSPPENEVKIACFIVLEKPGIGNRGVKLSAGLVQVGTWGQTSKKRRVTTQKSGKVPHSLLDQGIAQTWGPELNVLFT